MLGSAPWSSSSATIIGLGGSPRRIKGGDIGNVWGTSGVRLGRLARASETMAYATARTFFPWGERRATQSHWAVP